MACCHSMIFRTDEAAEARAMVGDPARTAWLSPAVREEVLRAAWATLHADRKARQRRAALTISPKDPTQPEDAA